MNGDHYVSLRIISYFLKLLINFPVSQMFMCVNIFSCLSVHSLKYHCVMAGGIGEEINLM